MALFHPHYMKTRVSRGFLKHFQLCWGLRTPGATQLGFWAPKTRHVQRKHLGERAIASKVLAGRAREMGNIHHLQIYTHTDIYIYIYIYKHIYVKIILNIHISNLYIMHTYCILYIYISYSSTHLDNYRLCTIYRERERERDTERERERKKTTERTHSGSFWHIQVNISLLRCHYLSMWSLLRSAALISGFPHLYIYIYNVFPDIS